MMFLPVQRATVLIPTPIDGRPDLKHLFILLTDPVTEEQLVLIVNLSSVKPNIPYDESCVLHEGDHTFIRKTSYVDYSRARIVPISQIQNGIKQGKIQPFEAIETDIFARVCYGLLQSRHTKPKLRRFYQDWLEAKGIHS